MFQAFLEGSLRIQVAAVSFILAKLTFVMTAICMAISDRAAIVSMSVYGLLVLNAIVLSLWEGLRHGNGIVSVSQIGGAGEEMLEAKGK